MPFALFLALSLSDLSAQTPSIRVVHSAYEIVQVIREGKKVFEFGKGVLLAPQYDRNFEWFRGGIGSVDEFPYGPVPYTSVSDIERELGLQWRMVAYLESRGVTDANRTLRILKESLLHQTETFKTLRDRQYLG